MWKCTACSWEGDLPIIAPGMSGGRVVDIIDIMCPNCNNSPRHIGTHEEKNAWWDSWYKKVEGESDDVRPNNETEEILKNDR